MNTYVLYIVTQSVSVRAIVTNNQHPSKPIFFYRICRYSDTGNRSLSCFHYFTYSFNIPLPEMA